MVQQLLDELHGDESIELFHVDSRLSRDVDDIASASLRKLALLLGYCIKAVWVRLRRGARGGVQGPGGTKVRDRRARPSPPLVPPSTPRLRSAS